MANMRVFAAAWKRLSVVTRMVLLALVFLVIAAVPTLFALTRDRSVALFATPLDPQQISEVDARLAAWGIAHASGTDSILIDEGRRNDVLLRLSLSGLPHPHVATSDEALAKLGALTPDALLAAQTRAGLSGDLAVALRGIDGVTDASVVIAPASQSAFTDESSSPASASVRLSLRSGVVLSADAVDGIRAFVANGVPGLARDHITILDDHGLDLSTASNKHDDAETIRVALQSALDGAFGAGSTIVRVHASYDQRSHDLHETDRLGVNGPLIASQGSDERLSEARRRYSKRELTQDRGSVVKDEHTVEPAGSQARLSIAVFVDAARGIDPVVVRGLAAATAGTDRINGDTVIVEPLHFAHAPQAVPNAGAAIGLLLLSIAPRFAALAVLTVLAFAVAKPLQTLLARMLDRESARATQAAVSGFAPRQVHGALSGEPPHTAAAVISALPAATAAVVLDFYSAEERTAIIARMSRPVSAFMPPWETLIRHD